MNRKHFAILLLVFLLLLGGCAESVRERTDAIQATMSAAENTTAPQAFPTQAPVPVTVPPTVPAVPVPPVTQPVPPPVETQNTPAVITSAIGLRDYLRSQEEIGSTDFSFRFAATTVDVSAQNIARVGGYFYVESETEGDLCHVRVTDYPGDRIVKAWRSGDYAALTDPERDALQAALDLVSRARVDASTELILERNLFDLLRSHVTYYDGSTEIADPLAPPRHLTAVGALADGSANCQGYADGFYVLASLAGFRVERMHVDIPEGGHTVNVILLDGAWYVVDATYNDLNDLSGTQISYCLMNVGKDKCLRYSWAEDVERYPIVEQTDHHFYYYQWDTNRCFNTVDAAAQRMVDDWRDYGHKEFYMLVEGQIATWQELGDALERIAAGYGLQITYNIWYEHNVEDTYFYVSLG